MVDPARFEGLTDGSLRRRARKAARGTYRDLNEGTFSWTLQKTWHFKPHAMK
jgi:hypothetical protein